MSELVATPVIESPPDRRRRLPIWLRWVVGIPLAICAAVLLTFPPRQATALNGWTPGCPELKTEPWRSTTLDKNELEGIDRYEVFECWPVWELHEGRMSINADINMADGRFAFITLAVPDDGIAPRVAISESMTFVHPLEPSPADTGDSAGAFWMTQDNTRGAGNFELIQIDPQTLGPAETIVLPLPMPANHKLEFVATVQAAGVADDGIMWLVGNYWTRHTSSGRQAERIQAWQFDPQTGQIGSMAEITLPTHQPNGTPFKWNELGVLTQSGTIACVDNEPPWVMQLTDWPTGSTNAPTLTMMQRHSTKPLARNPPVSKGWRAGWFEWWLSADAEATEAIAIRMPYRMFNLPKQAREVFNAPRMQQVPPGAVPSLRTAYQYTERTQSQLEWYLDQQLVKYQPFFLETSWSGTSPLAPELESSLRATLDHVRWIEWQYEYSPALRVAALDADSFLIVQMVVTDKTKDPLISQGVMRFGLLEKPNTKITWLGYLHLPEEFAQYRYRTQFYWAQEADGWRVMLSAVRDEEDLTRRGFWWTRVAYPAGWSPPGSPANFYELQYEPVRPDPAAGTP